MSNNIVMIGSSTGGPKVLSRLFYNMPRLKASVILVQHMPKFINESVRENLSRETTMEVVLASDGDAIQDGTVYLAPSEVHLQIKGNKTIRLEGTDKVNHVCPAVDTAMQSLGTKPEINIIGVILTGMGSDGAEGITHIKQIGGTTISQSETSCAVYGMPKAAYETGNIDTVLDPESIQTKLIQLVGTLD